MKKIYTFDSWLSEGERGLTQDQVTFLNKWTRGKWSYNGETGLVDVDGDFNCFNQKLKNLQGVRFGRVSGHFLYPKNRLTTLVGAPQEVGGGFDCSRNDLTTLEGAPQEVGGRFDCCGNQLTTLMGAPQEVGGDFFCTYNQLTTLVGAPQEVGGNFRCHKNKLTTLEGAPQEVGRSFDCSDNKLTSLEGAPEKIGGSIYIGGKPFSPIIKISGKDWSLQGWMRVWREGSEEAKALIATLPAFQETMKEHPEEFEDLSDLQDLGF